MNESSYRFVESDPKNINVPLCETFVLADGFDAGTTSYAWFIELDEGLELVREIHGSSHSPPGVTGGSHSLSFEIKAVRIGQWKAAAILQDRWGGKVSQRREYNVRVYGNCLPGLSRHATTEYDGTALDLDVHDDDRECCVIL